MLRRAPFLLLGASSTLEESLLAGLHATCTEGKEEMHLTSAGRNFPNLDQDNSLGLHLCGFSHSSSLIVLAG